MFHSCGIIYTDGIKFLVAHPTGASYDKWDIPKGCYEETDIDFLSTAIRELYEETGIMLYKNIDVILPVCENIPYLKNKSLTLFKYIVPKIDIDLQNLKCTSFFQRDGKKFPEVDEYKWITLNEINSNLFPSMIKVFNQFKNILK
jgi:predicted NUDIX family NTP pyrophosphohydrolase